jgi:5'-nucleotidase
MFVTHRKDLLSGDYLIDDRTANGAGEFKGELLLFGGNDYPDWNSILQKLL